MFGIYGAFIVIKCSNLTYLEFAKLDNGFDTGVSLQSAGCR